MEETYEERTAFDMGISTLGRINFWLYHANNANAQDDPQNYYKALQVIYHELLPFIAKKDDRLKIHNEVIKKIEKGLHTYKKIVQSAMTIHRTALPPRQLFDSLHNWDKELRIDLKKTGLLMREGERADSAML